MRRNAALVIMLASEVAVAALGLGFHLRSRAQVLRAFHEFDTAIPPTAAVALSPWFVPAALGAAAALTLGALVLPIRRSQSRFLVGLGLMIESAAVIFAIVAAFLPIFQPA